MKQSKAINLKISRILLFVFLILATNTIITVGSLHLFYQSYIAPIGVSQLADILIEANDNITTELPIDAKDRKQYIPEMHLSFPYEKRSDQLLYDYNDSIDGEPEIAVINYAASTTNTELSSATTYEELFKAQSNTADCRRIYAISYKNSLRDSILEAGKYESIEKPVKLDGGKSLYIFKLKKSCEAEAGMGPHDHKRIQEILSSAKSY